MEDDTLRIAEITYDSGVVRYRYSRYLAEDGKSWKRHGLFVQYFESGQVASEVVYEHGRENGPCRDYHENGELAAEGQYLNGEEDGEWRFWDEDGNEERSVIYRNGEAVED